MSISGLQKLDVWCKAMDFAVKVNKDVLLVLPVEEKWSLNQQLRRSSQSIPANIAEGPGRFYFQENVRFCYIARGSLEETLSHLVYANKVGYLTDALYKSLAAEGENLNRLINGYIGFLKKSKQGSNEPGANNAAGELTLEYIIKDISTLPSDSNNEYRSFKELL